MKESSIEQGVVKYAKEKGFLAYKFTSPSNRGVPDRIFIKNGKLFFIEFKTPGKKLSKFQEQVIKKLYLEGFKTYLVSNIAHGKNLINYYDELL